MALLGHYAQHWVNDQGNPAGGVSTGRGFTISWQNGPLGPPHSQDRREPNGAFVEDVIQAVIGRLEHFQESRFNCAENASALQYLSMAAQVLDERTKDRETRQVEGTYAF